MSNDNREHSSDIDIFKVSVNNMLATSARTGDINFRFSTRSSALEGIRGHQKLQNSRKVGYQSEVAVKGEFRQHNSLLQIAGRMDGIYTDANPVIIDEIKTLNIDVEDIPESVGNAHWAQVKIYGYLYAVEHQLDEICLQLSYFQIISEEVIELQQTFPRWKLQHFFETIASRYLHWMEKNQHWKDLRNRSIKELAFPYGDFRGGQRAFAVSAYRGMADAGQVLVQAPTGLGKTVGSLFPAIKAMGEGLHEKIFFLTAKTVGRTVAEHTLTDMLTQGLELKSVTLTAKDKICFNPGSACDPEHCQFAVGYYDKIDAVLDESLSKHNRFTTPQIEIIAREHQLCPFELSLDLSAWVDCIICDYNYVFDPVVYLRRFFDDTVADYCFLVDEAHNLVDRGRDMFSASLAKNQVAGLKRLISRGADFESQQLVRALQAVNRAFLNLRKEHISALQRQQFAASDDLPLTLLASVHAFCERAANWLAETDRSNICYKPLLELYFQALRLCRTSETFDENYICLLTEEKKYDVTLKLYCVNPAQLLQNAVQRAKSALFFSATLKPVDYYRELLGVEPGSSFVDLPSPFPEHNLAVYVVADIETNYRQRETSYDKILNVIDAISFRTGNYLVYFPSYQYMETVLQLFARRRPDVKTVVQSRGMSEAQRQEFLDTFDADNHQLLIGFALMGGIFGEGIDLKGKRLQGVVIVGVGLPQIGEERDLIRDHFTAGDPNSDNRRFQNSNRGFEYAYQYPGMVRVLQTAGRVIRSEDDRGIICLLDARFSQARYRRLFPPHWSHSKIINHGELEAELEQFWKQREQ